MLTRNVEFHMIRRIYSEINIIQAKEDLIISARVMASNIRQKLYVNLRWLFDHISGSMCSFELAFVLYRDMISVLPWFAAESSRKSI